MIIIVIIEKQTMKRIFRTKVMMTAAVLLMAAVPGRQRLAAQEAGVQDPDVEQADGKQGGVMMRRWR